MNLGLYEALLDETWRFTVACRNPNIRPTIYRNGKTYQINGAELFADVIWFFTVELVWDWIHVHGRIPFVHDEEWFCVSEEEWIHLLVQSSVPRNPFFYGTRIITGKLVAIPIDKPKKLT
jgi:hypothetical protein